jgi:hypothetical protein
MWILAPFILCGFVVAAGASGSLGVLVTREGRCWVGSLIYGLPSVLLGLLVMVFCIQAEYLWWVALLAAIPVLLGSFALWRGFRCGGLRRDSLAGVAVTGGVVFVAIVLYEFPSIERAVFLPFFGGAPPL